MQAGSNKMDKDGHQTQVVFRLEEGENVYIETPWVTDLGNKRYRMENTPFYYYGIALGDIITAQHSEEEGRLVFTRVLEKSGHKLVRIIFENPSDEDGVEKSHLESLVEMGCTYEACNPKYICLDIPPEIDLWDICNYLSKSYISWEHASPTHDELFPEVD